MKKISALLFLVIIIFNISCKEDTKQTKIEGEESYINNPRLIIKVVYKTSQPDLFKIMMNNIIVDEFQKKAIHFTEEVVPTTNYDEMNVNFDEGNLSKNIVFHLGNKVEKTVQIKSITINYGEKVFTISKPSDFNDYLIFNKFIEIEHNTTTIKTKRVEGKLHPTFSLRQKLINQLK